MARQRFKDAGEDIGPTAGTLGPVDQPIADATDHGAIKGIEHQVIRDPIFGEEGQPQDRLGKERICQDSNQGPQGETPPAQQAPAEQEERDVPDENHQADRPSGVMMDQLRDAADATTGELGRDHEQPQRHCLEQCASENKDIVTNCGPMCFEIIHWTDPFSPFPPLARGQSEKPGRTDELGKRIT